MTSAIWSITPKYRTVDEILKRISGGQQIEVQDNGEPPHGDGSASLGLVRGKDCVDDLRTAILEGQVDSDMKTSVKPYDHRIPLDPYTLRQSKRNCANRTMDEEHQSECDPLSSDTRSVHGHIDWSVTQNESRDENTISVVGGKRIVPKLWQAPEPFSQIARIVTSGRAEGHVSQDTIAIGNLSVKNQDFEAMSRFFSQPRGSPALRVLGLTFGIGKRTFFEGLIDSDGLGVPLFGIHLTRGEGGLRVIYWLCEEIRCFHTVKRTKLLDVAVDRS
ncbi:unnamed protein product [Rhizoctonia solani]|uniref:Uncharacterized protein n=1 Tax=Rhizoctonia solani TaxID=456999 RepID=A0A8H3CIT3_9AGAM|nr:unnamed protein product [Rhizoctonia solani]